MSPWQDRQHSRLVEGRTRDQTCVAFRGKVALLARRVSERLPAGATLDYDDLVSWGAIGLLEAFERFDPAQGVRFSTFAEHRIRGAIYDALRGQDTMSRRRRQMSRRIERAAAELRRRLDREPAPGEVATYLDMTLDDYHKARLNTEEVTAFSLDAKDDDGLTLHEVIDNEDRDALQLLGRVEVRRAVVDAVKALPERHRHCIIMYYERDLSLSEIGAVYGVSQSRISQILTDARNKLRKRLRPLLTEQDLAEMGAA